MPTPFAELEDRVNLSVMASLANATAFWTPAGGAQSEATDVVVPLPVFEVTEYGVLQVVSQVRLPVADWPGVAPGDAVACRGVDYVVRTVQAEPAGGLQRITLARA